MNLIQSVSLAIYSVSQKHAALFITLADVDLFSK